MTFNDCVSLDITLSGSISFSGRIDVNNLEFLQISMTFTSLTGDDGVESITISGTLNIDFSDSTLSMLMNFVARDNTTGDVVMLEDYSVVAVDQVAEASISISGKFYEPTHGFGVITTTVPLQILYSENFPYAGQFTLAGDNSSLRVTAINSLQYTLEVDEDGDGSYDITTTEDW